MRNTCALLLLLVSFGAFSQGVTIDTSTYTPDELINSVLINSPCIAGTNVVASTGSNFGSTNGIGYFENLNPNFPFERGIVLMTGDVTKVPSPNNTVLSDGSSSWLGDAELEANLFSQSGVTLNSINASYIEFEFVPTNNTIAFDFIFASEEYGTSQCNFSDAFAFLIKNITASGSNTNIALVPPATANIPVSVSTIRDSAYNSSCASVNPSFFGSFNGPGFGPAINFNGQTVQMTATATGLVVGNTYRIKIVIADGGGNVGYDSAIFLKANSFNSNADILGPDVAACLGANLPTLLPQTSLPAGTTYEWKKGGVAFSPAQTSASLNLNDPSITPAPTVGLNRYTLTYTEPGCAPLTDEIIVEIYPQVPVMATLPNLQLCNPGSGPYTFDLTKTTTTILTNGTTATNDDLPSGTIINYYLTNALAVAGSGGELPTSYSIPLSENNKTIFVRVTNPVTQCYTVRSFQLKIIPLPTVAGIPADMTLCARSLTDNRAAFDFTAAIATAFGAQDSSLYTITFHTSQANANSNAGLISLNNEKKSTQPNRNVWIRITNPSDPTCFVVSSTFFQLIVTPLPTVDVLPDVVVCSSFELPALSDPDQSYHTATNGGGTVRDAGYLVTSTSTIHVYKEDGDCKANDSFKVTVANLAIDAPASATYCTEYMLPALPYGSYYAQDPSVVAPGPANPVVAPYNITTTTTVYAYFYDEINDCSVQKEIVITIIPFVPLQDYPNKFACSSYTLNADPAGGTFYTGPGQTGPIALPAIYNAAGVHTVYVYKETGTSPLNCSSEKSFTITIGFGNITPPTDVESCSAYTLPELPVGEYYSGPNFAGPLGPNYVVSNPGPNTIYYGIAGELCTANLPFTVTVALSPLPSMPDVGPVCDVYYLPPVPHTGAYYTQPGGLGTMREAGFPVTTLGTTTWYFYDKAPTGPCFVEEEFTVTVHQSPAIDARPVEVIRCNDIYHLTPLANGHYYKLAGGPGVAGQVLLDDTDITTDQTVYVYAGSDDPANTCYQEYSIDIFIFNTQVIDIPNQIGCDTFDLASIPTPPMGDYYTAPGGPWGTGVKLTPPYAPITSTTTLYLYAENNSRVPCSDEDAFTITIHPQPTIDPIPAVDACVQYTLPAYNTFNSTPANSVFHYYSLPGGPGVAGQTELMPGDEINANATVYVYADISSAAANICPAEQPLVINITQLPVITPAITDLSGCDSVTLPALTVGNYFSDAAHTIPLASTTINTVGTTPVYIHAIDATNPACTTSQTINVTVEVSPVIDPITAIDACDSYQLPPYNTLTSTPAGAVNHYFELPGGPTAAGQIERAPGYIVNATKTFYVWAETGSTATTVCSDEEILQVNISATPVITPAVGDLAGCDSVTLPALTVGNYFSDAAFTTPLASTTITTPGLTTIYVKAESATNPACSATASFNVNITTTPVFPPAEVADVNTCNSYSLPPLSTAGAGYWSQPNGAGTNYPVGHTFTSNATVYAYAAAGTCIAQEDIDITIYNVPEPSPVSYCGTYTLPALSDPNAGYYSSPGGVGPITQVTTTQTVYVFGNSPTGGCSDEYSFLVTILPNAVANPVDQLTQLTVCDDDSNPDDGITGFDLDAVTPTILGSQDPTLYAVRYYRTNGDAINEVNEITTDNGPDFDTTANPIYVVVSSTTSSACKAYATLTINVIPKPHSNALTGTICYDTVTGSSTADTLPIQSGYSPSLYNFEWTDSDGNVVGSDTDFTPTMIGNYTLVITAIAPAACESDPIQVTVIESAKPASVTFATSGWFTNNQTITVTAVPFVGSGDNFVYSLDGKTPQSSNIFTNVSEGPHEITVIDIHGCGSAAVPIPVNMVSSPKFFSPNGDGFNDIWRISGLENQPTSKVTIFDRYGKLIKEFFLSSTDGWDGTFNGQPLPGDDYWFIVNYQDENGVPREYKSHFSLVR
jgi:gliding motility-associated-like protein